MSGLQVIAHIRVNLPPIYPHHPYVVALTANALDEDRHKCFEAGMNGFLTKPFRVDDLRQAILDAKSHLMKVDARRVARSSATSG